MKTILTFSISILILFGCGRPKLDKSAKNELAADSLFNEHLDSIFVYSNNLPNNTQIAIAHIRNGHAYFYGVKRHDDTLSTILNADSAFEIGSLTKVFTTTILANYVIAGKIRLDDKVNSVFQFPFYQNLEFTFKELANHTSGLSKLPSNLRLSAIFNQDDPYKGYDDLKFDKYLQEDIKLDYPKGIKSEYSNLGMGLLAYSLRKYSKKEFDELLKQMIFNKYQMFNSSTIKNEVAGILVSGQNDKGEPTANWTPGALIGAGGIYSTVKDLSKFAVAQFDTTNHELALTRIKTFKESESRNVGLGWFIMQRENGTQWYWHNGGTGGYSASMVVDVERKNGIIVLTNLSSYHRKFNNIDKLTFSLMKTLE